MAIQNTVVASINLIALPWQILLEDSNEFDSAAIAWPELPVQVHVLDFKAVTKLDKAFYFSATKFKRKVEARNGKVISINFNVEILKQVKSDGMEQTLGHVKDKAMPTATVVKSDSQEQTRSWMTKYALEATRDAMHTMFNTTVAADENYRETPKNLEIDSFFKVAVIEGRSHDVNTVFRLFFERKTLESLTRSVTDSGQTHLDEDLLLSIPSELLNIVYTSVKSKMNDERGYDLPTAMPVLVDPHHVRPDQKVGRAASWIPLVTPLGAYYLQIELGE